MEPTDVQDVFDADIAAELPPTVDRAAVRRIQFVAQLLDESVPIPGTNYSIGLDPIVGAVPGAGDSVSTVVSTYIVLESARLGVSYGTLLRMLGNVSVDFVGGSVPVLGTVFDAAWKANKRNVRLLFSELFADAETGPDERSIPVEME